MPYFRMLSERTMKDAIIQVDKETIESLCRQYNGVFYDDETYNIGGIWYEPKRDVYSVYVMAEGAIEREEYFPYLDLAQPVFDKWCEEEDEYNNEFGDGVYIWDMVECKVVARFDNEGKRYL